MILVTGRAVAGVLVGLFALLAAIAGHADAQVSHHLRFVAGPQVHVWGEAGVIGEGERVAVQLGRAAPEFSDAPDPVLGGALVPVSSEISGTSVQTLRIASNSGFRVIAEARSAGWQVEARLVAAGPNAQAIGAWASEARLGQAGGSAEVFSLTERTAAQRGDPASQAILLEVIARPEGGATGPPPFLRILAGYSGG